MADFERWLQQRLVAHGAKIAVDGDWGRNSIAAMEDFQRRKRLEVTGTANDETVAALRRVPGGVSPDIPAPVEKMPPWMAERRLQPVRARADS